MTSTLLYMLSAPHNGFMRQCYDLAREAVSDGNHPFGALLVYNQKVVACGKNSTMTGHDCTHHAEMNLVRSAQQILTWQELSKATLYSSTEPCAMCAGAIYWSGIRNVVFGCSAASLRELAGQPLDISCRAVYEGTFEPVSVTGPILEEEGLKIHSEFWKNPIHVECQQTSSISKAANDG